MAGLRDGRLLGLDAVEVTLVREWMDDGSLPSLRALWQRGAFAPLASSADWLVGSPWPTFYTGTPPEDHGLYHYLVWRPESMTSERPSPDWLPAQPFWRRLGDAGRRAIAIDVPLTCPPEPFEGVEISGWATHEILLKTGANPPDLMQWVRSTFGTPPFGAEPTHPLRADELLRSRDQWLETMRMVGDLGTTLAREKPWDLSHLIRRNPSLWPSALGPDQRHRPGDAAPGRGAARRSEADLRRLRPGGRPPRRDRRAGRRCWCSRSTAWARTSPARIFSRRC